MRNTQGTWVKGCREEDNKICKDFLVYCLEIRSESRMLQKEEGDRKERAEMRTKHWELLRLSTDFLKQNAPKWRTSRIL